MARRSFRVVGVMDEETKEYHLYVTNLPVDRISPEDVALSYRARWQVELTFKHLKSSFRLQQLPSSKKPVVEALIYASLLTLITSKELLLAIKQRLQSLKHRIKEGRWACLFDAFAHRILFTMNSSPRHARRYTRYLEALLIQEAVDPHVNRLGLIDKALKGTVYVKA